MKAVIELGEAWSRAISGFLDLLFGGASETMTPRPTRAHDAKIVITSSKFMIVTKVWAQDFVRQDSTLVASQSIYMYMKIPI
jgi:hypothetical protein